MNVTLLDNTTDADSFAGFVQHFTYLQWLMAVSCLLSVTGNALLLYLYYRTRRALTPFSVYVIYLLLANLTSALSLQNPFLVELKDFLPPTYWPGFCTFVRFASSATAPLISLSHMSIALNRVWAVAWPIAYRTHHTMNLAIMICVCSWMVVQIHAAVVHTVDAVLYLDILDDVHCTHSDPSPFTVKWVPVSNAVFYTFPEIVILSSYPYFVIKRKQARVKPMSRFKSTSIQTQSALPNNTSVAQSKVTVRPHRWDSGRFSVPFTLLSLMTISIAICWTPMNVYFLAASDLDNIQFLQVGRILKLVHASLDPVIFGAAVPELKSQFLRMMRPSRRFTLKERSGVTSGTVATTT